MKEKISRRDFLKNCGIAAGTAAFFTTFPWLQGLSEEGVRSTAGHKARIAFIGPGSRGQYLMEFMVQNPKAEIVWLCDNYEPNLKSAGRLAPAAKTTDDYRRVLEDGTVDAVVITTPLNKHKEIAVAAFQAGKHVFCEKSLSNTLDDSLEMYRAFENSGKVFFVGQQRLYDPVYLRMMEMINAGAFGPIEGIKTFWNRNNDWRRPVPSPELERKINWRLYRESSCGLMTELACHQIQMGTWIWRDIPQTIYGSGAITCWQDGREVEDNVSVIYTYADGRRMSFDSIISNKFYGLEEQIMGRLGTCEPEKGKYYYETTPPMPGFLNMLNDMENKVFNAISFAGPSWDPEIAKQNHGEFITGGKRDYLDGTPFLIDAFVEAVIAGKQPPMIAQEGYYATALSLLGQQAIDTKEIVTFPDKYRIDYL